MKIQTIFCCGILFLASTSYATTHEEKTSNNTPQNKAVQLQKLIKKTCQKMESYFSTKNPNDLQKLRAFFHDMLIESTDQVNKQRELHERIEKSEEKEKNLRASFQWLKGYLQQKKRIFINIGPDGKIIEAYELTQTDCTIM